MSSSTFEVREPENESEKELDFGLDTCEENGLEVTANVDGEVPKDHNYNKEPDVGENDEVKESDGEEAEVETMKNSTPKKKGAKASKAKKTAKTVTPKGKAKKEVAKKEPASKKGKKKEIVAEEDNAETEENVNNDTAEDVIENAAPVEETTKSSKRGRKRKVEEKENIIDQSIVEEVQNITEDASATVNETSTESPSKKKKTTKSENTPKAKKPSVSKSNPEGVTEDRTNLPKGWVRKTVTRKSGKTAGMIDVYIYSPEGIKFRSRPDVAAYLARTKSSLKIDDFDFSKRKSTSTNSPKKPVKPKSPPAKAKAVEKKKTPKKGTKLVVKITVAKKKKPAKVTKDSTKEVKQNKAAAGKSKGAKPKGNKKKKTA